MDVPSVYTPGAGLRPPVLAGREELTRAWRLMLNNVEARGRPGARDMIAAGPRGIGKTALTLELGDLTRAQGYEVVNLQAARGNSGLIDSLVRQAERRADAGAGPWQRTKRAFERIAAVNVSVAGLGAGLSTHAPDTPVRHGVAPEDLAEALAALSREVRADHPRGGVLVTVDEMQSAAGPELAMLAAAIQRLNGDHPDARVLFAGTALPHINDVLSQAGVTHADRLLQIRQLPLTLETPDALYAIVEPARAAGVSWDPDAADAIVEASNGYPYHLQVFADHAWNTAQTHTITTRDAARAIESASAELEERTLGPRLEELTGRQAELLCALAVNGGRASRGDITITLGQASADSFSRVRDELMTHGDIYAPGRGEMALTVPIMTNYIQANYERVRAQSTTPLLPLETLKANYDALTSYRAERAATAPGARHVPSRYSPGQTPSSGETRTNRRQR